MSAKASVSLRLEETIAARAKAKQTETLKKGDSPVKQISAEREPVETREELAKLVLRLEETIAARAKAKQDHNRKVGGAMAQKSAESPIETREELAKLAGVSHGPWRAALNLASTKFS